MASFEIVDAQLHASAKHPPETLIAMMDEAGVDAAVVVQALTLGFDLDGVTRAASRYPDRLGAVVILDPSARDLAAKLDAFRARPNALGVRIVIWEPGDGDRLREGHYEPLVRVAERTGTPLFIFAPRRFAALAAIARAHPDVLIVVDHLGLPQPPVLPLDPDPWEGLPDLLELAQYENVAVKWTAAPTLSLEPYPFADLWPPLHRVLDSFGVEHVIWGTDITRVGGLHSYPEAVSYLRDTDELSGAEKELLMGGTLRELLNWPAP